MRIDLPSGGWAEVPDPKALTNADRKALMRVMREARANVDSEDFDALEYFLSPAGNTVFAWGVQAWSFDLPLPSADLDAIDAIPLADYDAIAGPVGEAVKVLMPNTEDPTSDPTEASAA